MSSFYTSVSLACRLCLSVSLKDLVSVSDEGNDNVGIRKKVFEILDIQVRNSTTINLKENCSVSKYFNSLLEYFAFCLFL